MIALVPTVVHAAWRSGHAGIDRPGSDSETIAKPQLLSSEACFDACLAKSSCASWTFKMCTPSTVEEGTVTQGDCTLRTSVPPQTLAEAGECRVTSGTSAPARSGGLLPLKYQPLPLGTVTPRGWLRNQLVIMANGLSGHLDLFWDDVADSVWIGGKSDHSGAGHERGPYWLNGMVPLAAMLNATGDATDGSLKVDINEQVNRWISLIVGAQLPSGWLGPDDGFGGKGNDYWNGWNVAASLLQYADAQTTAGRADVAAKCNEAVLKYVTEVHRRMLTTPFSSWSQNRWQDWAYIVHWLLDQAPQGQEQLLWDAAELTQQQSWDWDAYYDRTGVGRTGAFVGKAMPKFALANVGGWTMYDHGVNNAMGTKSCAVWYRQSANETDAQRSYKKLAMQDEYHGQPHGIWSADECFGGRDLNRGIELCAVVEQMYSLQHMFRVQGDPSFLDRCERIAYNALPATITPDMWQHQYLQQANEINALYGIKDHVWQTDGADSTGFGVEPNFGCCTANMQQGWPKLVNNVLLRKGAPDGKPPTIAVSMLAPVEATVGWGAAANATGSATASTAPATTLKLVTDYPFGDNATIFVMGKAKLELRIPGWAAAATVSVNGGAATPVANGSMHAIDATGAASTVVHLELRPAVRVERGWGRAASTNGTSVVGYAAAGAAVPSADEQQWRLELVDGPRASMVDAAEMRSVHHDVEAEIDAALGGHHDHAHHHAHHRHLHEHAHHPGDGKGVMASELVTGGCSFTASRDPKFVTDLRSGNPGEVTTAVIGHPVWGAASPSAAKAHTLVSVSLAFRYIAGYTPQPGQSKQGSTLSVVLLDAANLTDVATVYTSPPLTEYSFDDYKGYSPPIKVDAQGLSVPNGRALYVAIRFNNNQRNLQVPLDPTSGLGVRVAWGDAATDAPVPPPKLGAATNAAAVLRGPLLYSLYLEQQCEGVVKTWQPFNNTDVNLVTESSWNFALSQKPTDLRFERLGGPGKLPFDITKFPSVIHAKARAVPGWTSSRSAADEPPPSPLDASQLDPKETEVLLVPYGASNLRMSGFPWY